MSDYRDHTFLIEIEALGPLPPAPRRTASEADIALHRATEAAKEAIAVFGFTITRTGYGVRPS